MIRHMITAGLAALALAPAQAQDAPAPAPPPAPQRVLVVLAHPDDELTRAPAIAAMARQGSRVRLVYATPGDAILRLGRSQRQCGQSCRDHVPDHPCPLSNPLRARAA